MRSCTRGQNVSKHIYSKLYLQLSADETHPKKVKGEGAPPERSLEHRKRNL